jgi:predicted enzyme related to lactoylglutathione lyase
MARIVHFEIHADDPQRAITFYTAALGWEFKKWDGPMDYWLVTTGPADQVGINGGLMKRPAPMIGDGIMAYVCTAGVEDLDAMTAKALAAGGKVALPKMPIPGVGWLAYFKDTEGNVFGMMQPDPGAK